MRRGNAQPCYAARKKTVANPQERAGFAGARFPRSGVPNVISEAQLR
jgi:hypothetical protein